MHLTIAPGIYVVGGSNITSENDCTTIAVCSLSEPPSCALIGCGSGDSIHAVLRNLLELGIAPSRIRYIIIPIAIPCLCGGCKRLKDAFPWLHVVASRSIARTVREGGCGIPIPVTIESNEINLADTTIRIESFSNNSWAIIRISRRSREELITLLNLESMEEHEVSKSLKGPNRIICLLHKSLCWRATDKVDKHCG